MAGLQVANGDTIHILRTAEDTMNKQPRTADKGYRSSKGTQRELLYLTLELMTGYKMYPVINSSSTVQSLPMFITVL